MMKVVVTGAGGNLGRHFVDEVSRSRTQWDVVATDVNAGDGITRADVTDIDDMMELLSGVDVVVHLAAIKRPGIVDDHETFHINATGTFCVFDACALLGVPWVVFAGSTAVLGTDWGRRDRVPEYLPFDEAHPLHPEDAYGLSKLVGESIARSFHDRTGMEVAVLRFCWVPTPEEMADLRANGGAKPRGMHHYSYLDVRDAVSALIAAVELEDLSFETMFVAADDSTLTEPLSIVLPREVPAVGETARDLDQTQAGVDASLAKLRLRWSAKYSWRD